MPKRIQRKRTKGWQIPPGAVYVGRPTRWGNPFTWVDAAKKYREAVAKWPVPYNLEQAWIDAGGSYYMLKAIATRNPHVLRELIGKDLVCWCPLDKDCHADVLLEIANEVNRK